MATVDDADDYDAALYLLQQHFDQGRDDADVEAAFGTYIRGNFTKLRAFFSRYVKSYGLSADVVDDLVNQSFAKLFGQVYNRKFDPGHPTGGAHGLLFKTIAPQKLAEFLKDRNRRQGSLDALTEVAGSAAELLDFSDPWGRGLLPGHTDGDHTDPTWDAVEDRLTRDELEQIAATCRLDPDERAVLVLGYELSNPPAALVAELLGLTPTLGGRTPARQVHDLRHSAKAKIRDWFAAHPDDDPRHHHHPSRQETP